MNTDNQKRHELKRDDAATMIRKAPRGTKFMLHVRVDVPVADVPDNVFVGGGSGAAKLSRKDAVKLVLRLFSDTLEGRGARVPVTVYEYANAISGCTSTYWIG